MFQKFLCLFQERGSTSGAVENIDIQAMLRSELKRRQDRNPAYSLRAFARSLKVSPAQLSQLVSGKRPLTLKTLEKLSRELGLSPLEKKMVLESTLARNPASTPALLLRDDEFRTISDWYHFAILSLTKVKGARKDPAWIAERLGIAVPQARDAVERLERLGILSSGREFRQITEPIRVISEVPSAAIQRSHQQNLSLAAEKLVSVPLERRDFSSMTMAVNPAQMARAKRAIEKFQDELFALLQQGQAEEVYTFACQLFPVTRPSDAKGRSS